jgi:hypothetical protein
MPPAAGQRLSVDDDSRNSRRESAAALMVGRQAHRLVPVLLRVIVIIMLCL